MEEKRFSVEDVWSVLRGKLSSKRLWNALLILLPSIIAIVAFFVLSNNYYRSPEKKYEITLYDRNDNIIISDSGFPDRVVKDSAVSIFYAMTSDLSRTSSLPAFIDQSDYIRAQVEYMNSTEEYLFYFSADDRIGYLSHGGNAYLVSEENTERFLLSEYAQSFYSTAIPPVLYGNSEVLILPKEVEWKYKRIDGTYFESLDRETSDEKILVNMSGKIDLFFDIEPDVFEIEVFKDGTKLFSGNYSELSALSLDLSEAFTVEVNAEWSKREDGRFFGKMKYLFDVSISDKAEFSVSGEEFLVDSVCVIKCTNVSDLDKIKIRSIPLLPSVPKFIRSGHDAIVLIPIVRNIESDVYELRISYGSSYDTFKINVLSQRNSITVSSLISEDKVKLGLSECPIEQFNELREFAAQESNGDKLYSGEFLDYTELGAEKYARYGDVYHNLYQKYSSKGCEYRFLGVSGAKVTAMNSGRVIKTGYNDDLGNYVIVSHGCGLATWYAHLDSIEVLEGDHLMKGETVGKAGTTGLSSVENVFVLVTLGSNLIDPDSVCGKSLE